MPRRGPVGPSGGGTGATGATGPTGPTGATGSAGTGTPWVILLAGADASGGAVSVSCAGAQVGDVVTRVNSDMGGPTMSNVSAHYEATITVADHIQQLDGDLSGASVTIATLVTP